MSDPTMDMIPDHDPLAEYLHFRLAPLSSRDWPTIAETVRAFLAERVTREKLIMVLTEEFYPGPSPMTASQADAILALLRRELGDKA